MKKIGIVGGGAAGMIAAIFSAHAGNEVHIFEKNNKLGKKMYITGKGRCNITNSGDIENFIDNIVGNPYFIYSSFYNFSNENTVKFFESIGVPTKTERGGRIFPVSDKAADVVAALERELKRKKVKVHYGEKVEKLLVSQDKRIQGLCTDKTEKFLCDSVLISTGGLSYPVTGSTGDGYKMAESVGHSVTKLFPSLVPLTVKETWCRELQGLSLKNIKISIDSDKKKNIYEDFGELMFTHYGVSGPVILSASRNIIDFMKENLTLKIDLKPALDEKVLDSRILRDFEEFKNKDFKNSLDELLPQKLIPVIIELSQIPPEKKVNAVTKEERKFLCSIIKGLKLTITGTRGFNEAVVTCGGVNISEIEPATMESKIVRGLYFAGEVIDIDAYTGGYNLQIAFSTGYTAGINM